MKTAMIDRVANTNSKEAKFCLPYVVSIFYNIVDNYALYKTKAISTFAYIHSTTNLIAQDQYLLAFCQQIQYWLEQQQKYIISSLECRIVHQAFVAFSK